MIELLIHEAPHPPRTLVTNSDDVLIGSASECDVTLGVGTVQRRHCYLEQIDGVVFAVDNGCTIRLVIEHGDARPEIVTGERMRFEVGATLVLRAGCRITLMASNTEYVGPTFESPAIAGVVGSPVQAQLVGADWFEANGAAREAEYLRAFSANDGGTRLRLATRWVPAEIRARVAEAKVLACEERAAKCPGQWSALELGVDPFKRRCTACQREVMFMGTYESARRRLQRRAGPIVVDPAEIGSL